MATRLIRQTALLLKMESSYGVDATPSGAANAILASDVTISTNWNNIERKGIYSDFVTPEHLPGPRHIALAFTLELASAGNAGVAPVWGNALQACGWGEHTINNTCVYYTPDSISSLASATIYYYDSGLLHKVTGFRGHAQLKLDVGAIPTLRIEGLGLDSAVSEAVNPEVTLTAWHKPTVIKNTQAALGFNNSTFNTSTGNFSLGPSYNASNLQIDLGEKVEFIPLLNDSRVVITDRIVTGSCKLNLTAEDEKSFYDNAAVCGVKSLGFQIGTTAGDIIQIYAPQVQLLSPKKSELNGVRLIEYDLRMLSSFPLFIIAR